MADEPVWTSVSAPVVARVCGALAVALAGLAFAFHLADWAGHGPWSWRGPVLPAGIALGAISSLVGPRRRGLFYALLGGGLALLLVLAGLFASGTR